MSEQHTDDADVTDSAGNSLHSATMRNAAYEFLLFGLKQARACIFAGSFFGVLILSKTLPLGSLPRYDFI